MGEGCCKWIDLHDCMSVCTWLPLGNYLSDFLHILTQQFANNRENNKNVSQCGFYDIISGYGFSVQGRKMIVVVFMDFTIVFLVTVAKVWNIGLSWFGLVRMSLKSTAKSLGSFGINDTCGPYPFFWDELETLTRTYWTDRTALKWLRTMSETCTVCFSHRGGAEGRASAPIIWLSI